MSKSLDGLNKKTTTLEKKTPLGFSLGDTIEILGDIYIVDSYDTTAKSYGLKDLTTGDIVKVEETNLKDSWKYPGALSNQELADEYTLLGQKYIEEANHFLKTNDIEGIVATKQEVIENIMRLEQEGANKDLVAIFEKTKAKLEAMQAGTVRLQEINEALRQTEAGIDMLKQSIAKDDEQLVALRKVLAKKELEEKNTAGKKIFDEEVATARGEVLGTGIDGEEYYYDEKNHAGEVLRRFYKLDGSPNGFRIIAEAEKNPKLENENAPGEYGRLMAIVRFQVENPKEPTTIETEKFLQQYPELEKTIRNMLTEQRRAEDKAVRKRGMFGKNGPIDTLDKFNADPLLEYPDLRDELSTINFTYANKLLALPLRPAVEKKLGNAFTDTYTPLTQTREKEAFILSSGHSLIRSAFNTSEEFVTYYEKNRNEVLYALETGEMKKVLAAEGFVPEAIERFEKEDGRIEKEFVAVLKTYGLEKK